MTGTLVTGGTGTLGRDLVPALRALGGETHVLSRSGAPQTRRGDLASGEGLDVALRGIDTIVHLAAGRDQPGEARNLVRAAATAAGIRHLVFISIVGIDKIPLPYYRDKLAAETVIAEGAVPATILRTTQFHQFAEGLFAAQRWLPVLFSPRLRIQPIDTRVVAEVLAGLASGGPRGRVADLGGPEVLSGGSIARLYRSHLRSRKPIVEFSLPGRLFAQFAAGHNVVPGSRAGGRTFGQYLADKE